MGMWQIEKSELISWIRNVSKKGQILGWILQIDNFQIAYLYEALLFSNQAFLKDFGHFSLRLMTEANDL